MMNSITVAVVILYHLPIIQADNFGKNRAFDVMLQSLGFGPCTGKPERCGYRDRGYAMIKFSDDSGLCSEICSVVPFLNFGYQCGSCDNNGREICSEENTIPCLQGLGWKMFDIDDSGECNEICVIGSAKNDRYSCGECRNTGRSSSAPDTLPTRRPVATTPVFFPSPLEFPPTSFPTKDAPPTRRPISVPPGATPVRPVHVSNPIRPEPVPNPVRVPPTISPTTFRFPIRRPTIPESVPNPVTIPDNTSTPAIPMPTSRPITMAPESIPNPVRVPATIFPTAVALPISRPMEMAPEAVPNPVPTTVASPISRPVEMAPESVPSPVRDPATISPINMALPVNIFPTVIASPISRPVQMAPESVPNPVRVPATKSPIKMASPTRPMETRSPQSVPNSVSIPATTGPARSLVPVAIPKSPTIPVTVPVTTPLPDTNPRSTFYQIDLDLVNMSNELRAIFDEAKGLWEGVVVGDLFDIKSSLFPRPPIFPECSYPEVVDDLYICASLTDIDGLGRVVGTASPTFARTAAQGSLPSAGVMRFDAADIENLQAQNLTLAVISHEMGHVLGIGSTWEFFGVTGSIDDNCPYVGEAATAEYKIITGCDTIPIEKEGNTVSSCRHWSEKCLDSELMTPKIDRKGTPLSRVTIGSLEDLGYVVDYTRAETFTRDDIDASCLCTGNERRQLLRHNSNLEQTAATYLPGRHGDYVLLNDMLAGKRKDANRERRRLNEDLRQYALSYGLKILNENAVRSAWASAVLDLRTGDKRRSKPRERVRDVGQHYMSVIVRQDDDYFGVLVVRDHD